MMRNAMCFVLCLRFRRSHSPHTNAFEKEAHGRLDTLLDGLSRRRAQCPTPRLASENQTEKHVCRELGVAHTDLVLLDIVREQFARIKARPSFKGIADYLPTDYDDTGRDGLKDWPRIKQLIAT
jgi:hypothetical protein